MTVARLPQMARAGLAFGVLLEPRPGPGAENSDRWMDLTRVCSRMVSRAQVRFRCGNGSSSAVARDEIPQRAA